jgi:hypothetical protein
MLSFHRVGRDVEVEENFLDTFGDRLSRGRTVFVVFLENSLDFNS